MKIRSFLTMTMAVAALVLGMSSCGSDDDEPEVALATQVVGSYEGNEVVMVMGEESSNETKTYQITKVSDTTIDLVVSELGMGMMTIPSYTIKSIPLTKSGNSISGKQASYAGTVVNAQGDEKAYTVSDVTLLVSDKNAVVTFSLKYGNMPMAMETTFAGVKK